MVKCYAFAYYGTQIYAQFRTDFRKTRVMQ
jgi:hypothetical protein